MPLLLQHGIPSDLWPVYSVTEEAEDTPLGDQAAADAARRATPGYSTQHMAAHPVELPPGMHRAGCKPSWDEVGTSADYLDPASLASPEA